MSETEHEQETEGDEAAGAPVSPETAVDDSEAQEDAEAAEEPSQPPAEGRAAGPQNEKEARALSKKLDTERDRHTKKLSELLGDVAVDVEMCPVCGDGLQGFVYPGQVAALDDEQRAALVQLAGIEPEPEYAEAVGVKMCEKCNGLGQLRYPTRVPHVELQNCPVCLNKGYVLDEPAAPPVAHFPVQPQPPNATGGAGASTCPICGAVLIPGAGHWCAPQAAGGAV